MAFIVSQGVALGCHVTAPSGRNYEACRCAIRAKKLRGVHMTALRGERAAP